MATRRSTRDGRRGEEEVGAAAQPLSLAKGHLYSLNLGCQCQFRMSGTAGDHGGGGLHPSQDWRL